MKFLPLTFPEFRDHMKDLSEMLVGGLHGEHEGEDFMPMLLVHGPDGMQVHAVSAALFATPASTMDLIRGFVLPLVRDYRATQVGWSLMAWSAPVATAVDLEIPPGQHPDRSEIVAAVAIDREVHEVWQAEVYREPARLSEWRRKEPNESAGRLVTPVQEALR